MFSKKSLSLVSATVLALVGGLAGTASSIAAPGNDEGGAVSKSKLSNSVYIVRMADAPAVAYDGTIKGYLATRPKKGQKINPDDPNVGKYFEYLSLQHDGALAKIGGARKLYSYGYVFNGFAAEVSAAQAALLSTTKGVLSVEKDEFSQFDTSSTPDFLGLSGTGGFWNTKAKGENVIIGMVDTGIWPEHLSFSDRTGVNGNATKDGKLDYQQIPGWHGKCTPGEEFNASNCNQKLIGARYYNAGFGGNAEIDSLFPFEFNSPRDWAGHGTHTSSTAGGNRGVPATGLAAALGSINGIAPRARIATYKVCWADQPTGGGCAGSDMVAGIDQAIADGVDVLNFSISGTRTNFLDAVQVSFLFAADAGVFVAASAGNSGPTSSTVAHPGPWLTTVAAGTHNRNGTGSTTLGNAATYAGASFANALASMPLIDSESAGLPGMPASQVAQCWSDETGGGSVPGTPIPGDPIGPRLDPAKIAGKIVLCKRGSNALVDKSGAVAAAGGVGAIIYNDPVGATTTLALVHAVPAVHVVAASGAAIKTYIAGTGTSATASIAQSTVVLNAAAPFTATFSSRGPLLAGNGNLLKPDLIAPGQDILAGVAPPNNSGRLFDLYSGTSMSSPHVAGLAALFKELYPSWSPMMIKSALMTTGVDVLDGGTPPVAETNPVLIFRQGAGHVQPNQAANPGLVFNSGFNDWLAFLCGTGQLVAPYCPGIAINPSNLNVASIAIGAMPGAQTVTRTVINVGGAAETYTATVNMPGFTVTLPGPFTVNSGASSTFSVSFLRTTALLNAYSGGQLRLTGNLGHVVRVPIVVRPVTLGAPVSVSGNGSAINFDVLFGYTGAFSAAARGLVAAVTTTGTVADDPTNGACSLTSPNAQLIPVVIPAGTTYARFSLFDADVNPGSDIDLCVFNGATNVGGSFSGTSAEEVNLLNPAAATYTVVVQGWGVVGSSPFKLYAWALGSTALGNMTVSAPATATAGTTGTIALSFSGLAASTKYLGSVAYSGASGLPNPTIVRVDTP
ncbi:MAG: peptidase and subtilisin kexin sedolisin [Steroidobacteraceae bacterium]|nr:peptidase and subtilisin kexin sedolisin [Steroidobacteraceae bacterium]